MTFNPTGPERAPNPTVAEIEGQQRRARSQSAIDAKPPRRSSLFPILLVILIVLLAVQIAPWFTERVSYSITRGRTRAEREVLESGTTSSFAELSRRVSAGVDPSVVHINTRSSVPVRGLLGNMRSETDGQGSGVVIDEAGYILTNFHVVAGATQVNVKLSDDRVFAADLAGADEFTDLAVLKINAEGLIPLKWGDSEALRRGDPVWAVGSPFGLANSVSLGIVAAKGRKGIGHSRFQDFLQTDAAINPGNSGGALVNEQGELIGINTAIIGEAYQGISFAIPSNMAREVYEQIRISGQVARGWFGVQLDQVTEEIANELELPKASGALVVAIVRNSPADRGGVERGDVVVNWSGTDVENPRQFADLVAETEPETEIDVVVMRFGERVTLTVRVGRLAALLKR
jgi:S1-C subfamily serine protease